MKASKFTDAEKAFIVKKGEESTLVADICRKAGIHQASDLNWSEKYAGLLLIEMVRLKQLENENLRLQKIVADLTLDREMVQDAIRRTDGLRIERTEAWSHARTGGLALPHST